MQVPSHLEGLSMLAKCGAVRSAAFVQEPYYAEHPLWWESTPPVLTYYSNASISENPDNGVL